MKKNVIILISLLFVFPLISSVQINMSSEFPQGETIIGSIEGNLIESLNKNNFEFYRGHVRTSFDYSVAKIKNDYYFYVQLGSKLPNNYSVVIKNVRYLNETKIVTKDIIKNFTITKDKADFSVDPGFIIVTNGDFSFKLQNLQSSGITINMNEEVKLEEKQGFFDFFFNNEDIENSLTLFPKGIDYLDIIPKNITNTTIRTIVLNTENTEYKIPVYYIVLKTQTEQNQTENETNIQEELNETINETEENEQVNQTEGEECSWFEKLFGLCDKEIPEEQNETEVSKEEQNNTETENPVSEEQNQTENETNIQEELNETINETEENIEENETITETEKEYEIVEEEDGDLIVIEDGKIIEVEASLKTCKEMKGDVCEEGEICNTKTVYAKDNKCCITACAKKPENEDTKLISGAIILVLVLVVLWFLSKFRKTKNKKDSLLRKK